MNAPMMRTYVESKPVITELQRNLYEDQYATVSYNDAIPCIKVKLNGVPQSSEHYQFVHYKVLECITSGTANYIRLHLLTDCSKAGPVLDEDMDFYNQQIIPAIEKAGIRYHAIVLPESFFARMIINQIIQSTKKLKVEYFNTVSGASRWLKNR